MRSIQQIAFDVTGQSVYFDCPEGRPSSVTSVEVWPWDVGDDQITEAAVAAPSIETSPNTTIDAYSGYGSDDPRRLNVTATTGMATGRTYLVTAADGRKEWFEAADLSSGAYVTARHPLHNSYTNGDTVQTTRIQAAVNAAWVADEDNLIGDDAGANPHYRVRWVYVVGGVTYVADSYFNLSRYVDRHGITALDVEELLPGWMDMLPTDHRADQGRRLISAAYREIRIDLHQIDMSSSAIAESEVMDELVRLKAIEQGEWARYLAGVTDSQRVRDAAARYRERLDSLLRIVSRVPVRDEDGAATPVVAQGLSRR